MSTFHSTKTIGTTLTDFGGVAKTVATKLEAEGYTVSVQETAEGYFLRFPVDDIPEKKKAAIGVRGIKLGTKDVVENVYYTRNAVESTIEYKNKTVELNKIKLGSRDSKGVKIRI